MDDVHRDPLRAARIARDLLDRNELDPRRRAMLLWLLGRAQNEVDDVVDACTTLADARETAVDAGDAVLAAEIAVSESACLMANGETTLAFERLAAAEPSLSGGPLGRLVMQRGLLNLHRGLLPEALADLDRAEPLLDHADDRAALARLLANRGVTLTNLRLLDRSRADLERCREIARTSELDMIAAGAAHNLGYLGGQVGDIPEALRWIETARAEYERLGLPRRLVAALELDLCTSMSIGGLYDDAIAAGTRAVDAARNAGDRITLGDALLQLALAMTAAGRPRAADIAREARDVLRDDDRDPLAALAWYVAVRAEFREATDIAARDLPSVHDVIDLLDRHGWSQEANDIRLFVAERSLDDPEQRARADELLARVSDSRRDGPWHRRVTGWYAEGLRRSRSDVRAAMRALLAGLRIADTHRATLAASDLRAHLSIRSAELARLGLELASSVADPALVLAWAERTHAPSMGMRPVRPPSDEELAQLLQRLRHAYSVASPDNEIAAIESEIRRVSRSADSSGTTWSPHRLSDLSDDFGHVDLVEYFQVDGDVRAVTVVDRTPRLHALGSLNEVDAAATFALAALRRLARRGTTGAAAEAARSSLDESGRRLSELLVDRLDLSTDRPLVVVPDPSLRLVPWSTLRSLRDRAWTLAPNATTWARRGHDSRPATRRGVALFAGPDLDHAEREVQELESVWRTQATAITGSTATVETALTELTGRELVHFAAHGRFRTDSPSFSAIRLVNGDLTVYDLETITDPPAIVVIASCELGQWAVRGGGDVLGTAAALLQLGVESVIAPTTIVSDAATTVFMTELHRHLEAGDDPGTALRRARLRSSEGTDVGLIAAAASFVAISAARVSLPAR